MRRRFLLWLAGRLLDWAARLWPSDPEPTEEDAPPPVRVVSEGWAEDPAHAAAIAAVTRRRALLNWWHAEHPECRAHTDLYLERNEGADGWNLRCPCGAEGAVLDEALRC